ncbi:sensor domain-containing protein [Microbacterium aurantiacum]|uniref:sensor domain-containing protein n=1 Tax=Microbacterium aurantiacum TaxID=162393 RepID=UPI0007DA6C6F|nr:diguanylate cyclase [Microbacterium chocolatum]ANG85048.1 PAS domain S-box protein [Microbacterium chocolatum]
MTTTDAAWYDRAPCGLIATDLDGTIVDVNETLLQWTGHTGDGLVGRSFTTLLDRGSQMFFEARYRQLLHLRGTVNEQFLTLRTTDGFDLPVLVNAARDEGAGRIRFAILNATERVRYERELVTARRIAEEAAQRVRILQEVSTAFGVSATDEDVAQTFAAVAREAFSARDTGGFLLDDNGELTLVAGANPLEGKVRPVPELRETTIVTVVHDDDANFPEVAQALKNEDLTSLSIMPLSAEGERLGVLVCFFATRSDFDAHFFDLQQALGRQASQTLQRVRLQRQLAVLALHDQLTGVANRQLLQLTLDEALHTATTAQECLAVLFLDIDDFKSINDSFGHATGDLVLVELATRLRDGVRAHDVVGRIGGDEFVALCPSTDAVAAEAIAERILAVCRKPITVPNGVISASVSVGLSLFDPATDTLETGAQLLVRADAAMYDAKRAGKDRVTVSAA